MIGSGPGEVREEKVLNRVLRLCEGGWEYEADQRHAEMVVKTLGLEEARSVQTPCEDERVQHEEEEEQYLSGSDVTTYRALAARINYLALDRADIQYAAKEVCRGMSRPSQLHWRKLKRLGRYLIARPRVVTEFKFQAEVPELHGYSDSDWAGCRRTAKSTSGGAIMRGGHCLKTWSNTQKNITLSSAEAELVAAVRMSTELIGMSQLAADWDTQLQGRVLVDSTAALGVVKRQGNGRLRHIKVGMLWVQQQRESGELVFDKVAGQINPADLMTKVLTEPMMSGHMSRLNQVWKWGRADKSLQI